MNAIELRKAIARGGESTLYMEGYAFSGKVKTIDTQYETVGHAFGRSVQTGVNTIITVEILEYVKGCKGPFEIKKVIFSDPATIVLWEDGTKTIVKVQEGDTFDPEKGLAMAISKKALGNKGNYCEVFKRWAKESKEV